MLFITLYFLFSFAKSDLVVVDQITFPIPLLRLFGKKTLYYCHFPESLLNDNKKTPLIKAYRLIFDTLEILCLHLSTIICFNSNYTKETVEKEFKSMKKWKGPKYVVYPCMQSPKEKEEVVGELANKRYLLTINRYETRKRLDVCIEAFGILRESMVEKDMRLVIAGGLDRKNKDAVSCREALGEQVKKLGISDRVSFYENITEKEKEDLMR